MMKWVKLSVAAMDGILAVTGKVTCSPAWTPCLVSSTVIDLVGASTTVFLG